jgi:hypothetical protein
MEITFITNPRTGKRERIEINDAQLVFRNFSGAGSTYNHEGDRNFAIVVPNQEICDALTGDVSQYGDGWNVKIKPPKDGGDTPFMFLPVKVKFNERGPKIFVRSDTDSYDPIELNEDTVNRLDRMDIVKVDLDIRPYDGQMRNGDTFRSAYLQSMEVTQRVDRFAARYSQMGEDDMLDF